MSSSHRPISRALFACLMALLVLATRARAQKNEDFGIWIGGLVTGKLPRPLNDSTGRWRLWLDGQYRLGDDASKFAQGIIRPGIGYALSSAWTAWLGYAWIQTNPPYASVTTYEQRLWEQASWATRLGPTRFSSRTRLEERFVSTGPGTGWRLRELVKLSIPLPSIWSAVVYDEFFFNLNSTSWGQNAGSDRNRFFIGPGLALGKHSSVEIGYLRQTVYRSNSPDKLDNVLAVNAFWTY